VVVQLSGGVEGGAVKSSTALFEMAASEGYDKYKDYDWRTFNRAAISQKEIERMENELARFIRTKTKSELFKAALEKEILLIPVNDIKDVAESPQLTAREFFQQTNHPEIGVHAYNAPAYKLSKTPADIRRAGPTLGQDNAYVFKELIGMTDDEIADLLIAGTITTEDDLSDALK
jgi:crotonobetainyl-CoA:carnitine CoA-transferase CaiB-like acyl-CoA transferase